MARLDWNGATVGDPAPCVLCGKPALMRSPRGVPCHKTCAERWHDEHGQEHEDEARADRSGRAGSAVLRGGERAAGEVGQPFPQPSGRLQIQVADAGRQGWPKAIGEADAQRP